MLLHRTLSMFGTFEAIEHHESRSIELDSLGAAGRRPFDRGPWVRAGLSTQHRLHPSTARTGPGGRGADAGRHHGGAVVGCTRPASPCSTGQPAALAVFAEDYAAVSAELGEPERAAFLLGAAEAVREQLGIPRPEWQSAEIAAPIAKSRAAVSAEEWAGAVPRRAQHRHRRRAVRRGCGGVGLTHGQTAPSSTPLAAVPTGSCCDGKPELRWRQDYQDAAAMRAMARGIEIERDRQNVLVLNYTMTCPLACDFCCYASGPRRGETMDLDLALDLVDQAADLGVFGACSFTGGDPFVYHDDMLVISERMKRHGLPFQRHLGVRLGNGRRCSRRDPAATHLQRTQSLTASHDPSHQRWVPRENIRRVISRSIELGVAAGIYGAFYDEMTLERLFPEYADVAEVTLRIGPVGAHRTVETYTTLSRASFRAQTSVVTPATDASTTTSRCSGTERSIPVARVQPRDSRDLLWQRLRHAVASDLGPGRRVAVPPHDQAPWLHRPVSADRAARSRSRGHTP